MKTPQINTIIWSNKMFKQKLNTLKYIYIYNSIVILRRRYWRKLWFCSSMWI